MNFWNVFLKVELMEQRAQKPGILLDNVQLVSNVLTNSKHIEYIVHTCNQNREIEEGTQFEDRLGYNAISSLKKTNYKYFWAVVLPGLAFLFVVLIYRVFLKLELVRMWQHDMWL